MKNIVKILVISILVMSIVAIGIKVTANRIEAAFNAGFKAGIEHTVNSAIVWVTKVNNNLFNVYIEVDGEVYVHEVTSIEEE